jgi:hypothetical protein
LAELNVLATKLRGQADLQVFVINPSDCEEGWEKTDLVTAAEKIPGVGVHFDRNGAEAACFGATTSGEAMLFDRDGRRLFRGGITVSRGHEGDNPGLTAIAALIGSGNSGRTGVDATPVYGCSLFNQCLNNEDSQSLCRP